MAVHARTLIAFTVVSLLVTLSSQARAEDWPQWRGVRRDGTWEATNLIDKFDSPKQSAKWRQPISSGYSGPTVSDGRVFITDRVDSPEEIERIHCLDFETGKPLWLKEYPCPYGAVSYKAGPRAAVAIDSGLAYALGSTGKLHCLRVEDGEIVWFRDLDEDYDITRNDNQTRMPIWGISASPLLVDDLVVLHIGGRDGACVVALDKLSGKERWRALDDRAQYSTPILIQQAGRDVVVVWTGDSVAGLDPKTGTVFWRHEMKPTRMPIGCATPIVQDDMLYVTSFYDGSLMLRLDQSEPKVTQVWRAIGQNERNTKALHSIISTPIWLGHFIYGVDSYGELRCLNAKTGKRIWEDKTATPRARWSTIHFTKHDDDIWMFNERGELLISRLSEEGFEEISRTKILEPTMEQLRQRKGVCWSHPAFANGHIIARNDKEIVCVDLRAK